MFIYETVVFFNCSIVDIPNITDCEDVVIGPLITDQFDKATLEAFLTVQFTHHYEILQRTDTLNERLFYIHKVASEFWSVDKLKYNMREQLYLKEGTMPNNFAVTLPDGEQKQKAMRAFRKNYKLDFIEIDDVDEWDEHKELHLSEVLMGKLVYLVHVHSNSVVLPQFHRSCVRHDSRCA